MKRLILMITFALGVSFTVTTFEKEVEQLPPSPLTAPTKTAIFIDPDPWVIVKG